MKNLSAAALCLALILNGCAYVPYARESKKKPREGGVISLKSDHRPEDQQKAQAMMAANCGNDRMVKILEEGEVVVGERSNTNSNSSNRMQDSGGFRLGGLRIGGSQQPGMNTNSVSQTEQIREWQIAYTCESMRKK
ncbi:MAG: hypothetical protein M9962_13990 [Oligoflexia bacterium]|nr:hypothetical protein [Oligoflexia bacterium]